MRMNTRPVTFDVASANLACVRMDLMAVALSVPLFTTLGEDLLIAALPAQTVSACSQR